MSQRASLKLAWPCRPHALTDAVQPASRSLALLGSLYDKAWYAARNPMLIATLVLLALREATLAMPPCAEPLAPPNEEQDSVDSALICSTSPLQTTFVLHCLPKLQVPCALTLHRTHKRSSSNTSPQTRITTLSRNGAKQASAPNINKYPSAASNTCSQAVLHTQQSIISK
jgi:hypothetical protein